MRDPPLSPLRTPLLPPPKNSRWGYRERGVDYSTYLVRHHHASIWLCNFIAACMEAAWMHPHASLPETFSLRERLSNWILMGFCAGQLRGGVQRGVRQPLRQAPQLVLAASKQHQLRLLLQQHLRSFCSTRPLLAFALSNANSATNIYESTYLPSHPPRVRALNRALAPAPAIAPRPRPRPRPPAPQTPPLPPPSPGRRTRRAPPLTARGTRPASRRT